MKHRTRDVDLLEFALFCFVHTVYLFMQYKQLYISHLNSSSCQTTPDPGSQTPDPDPARKQASNSRPARVESLPPRPSVLSNVFPQPSLRGTQRASWSVFPPPLECPGRVITCPIRNLHTNASKSTTAVPSISTQEAENHIHRIKIVAYMSALERDPYGAHTHIKLVKYPGREALFRHLRGDAVLARNAFNPAPAAPAHPRNRSGE